LIKIAVGCQSLVIGREPDLLESDSSLGFADDREPMTYGGFGEHR
jgi:hypothetical protein